MNEIIACPSCRRRLQLPRNLQVESVRCPACRTEFAPASAPKPVEPPHVLPVEVEAAPPTPSARPERLPQKRRVQKASRSGCTILALAIGLIVLTMGLAVAGIFVLVWRSTPSRMVESSSFPEDDQDAFDEMLAAFRNQPPLDEKQIAQGLQPLFHSLGASLRVFPANSDSIMRHFDIDRMSDEIGDPALVPHRKSTARRPFVVGLRRGMGTGMARRSPIFQWTTSEIRNVKKLNNEECVVIVRHKHPNGTTLKVRWWLTRRTGGWKIYDFESLDVGMRVSTTAGSLAQLGAGRLGEVAIAGNELTEAGQALAVNDIAGAEVHLKNLPANLPPRLEALRLLLTAIVHLHYQRSREALDSLEAAKRLHADMPVADFLRGLAFTRLGKWDEALKCLNDYRTLLGDDEDVCRELGDALRGARRFDEASIEYRKSLDLNPRDAEAFRGFLRSLGGDANKDDVGPRFAKLTHLRENFDVFAADCEQRQFPELLLPLVLTMRRLDPLYPPVDFYGALAEARLNHPAEAVRLIQSAFREQEDLNQRKEYARQFLAVMGQLGHVKEAYLAVSDTREAFRILAAESLKFYHLDALKALLPLHRAKDAADPLLPLYEAEMLLRDLRYPEANRLFDEAVEKRVDAEILQSFRASRVTARFHNGQILSAYRKIGPRDETFAQLAQLCYTVEDDAALETLLAAHEKNRPSDPDVPRYRSRMQIRQKKIVEGIASFRSALAKQTDKAKRSQLVAEFLTCTVEAEKPLEGYRAAPDAKDAFLILARQLTVQDRLDELRALIEVHGRANIGDPWIAYYLGELHLSDKEWQKAAESLGLAMIQGSKEQRMSFRRSYVYAMYKCGRTIRAYRLAEPRETSFAQLADLIVKDKNGAALEELVQAHRANTADVALLLYWESRAKLLQNQWKEATELFVQGVAKDKMEYRRSNEVRQFLTAMMEEGHLLDGWRAVPDRSAAFNAIMPILVSQKKIKELQELLDDFGKGRANDASVLSYRGELALLRKQPKEAAAYFAKATAKKDPRDLWRSRFGLFRARVELGEATAVYEQFLAEPNILDSVANLCKEKKDARQLRSLLEVHRKHKADDPGLIFWEMEARWMEQNHEGALRLICEHRDDVFDRPNYRWRTGSRLIRCYVKLKRYQEAIREAEKATKMNPYADRFELIFALASAGDVPRTVAALQKVSYRVYMLRRCYEDEELGPILRSEAFRAFREKYPQPKKAEIKDWGEDDED